MWDFVVERREQIAFQGFQHVSLVVQCVLLATVLGTALGVVCHRRAWARGLASTVSSIGLTLPALAVIALVYGATGQGITAAVVSVTFYALLVVWRNAVVGLSGVDGQLLEAAQGLGMGRSRRLLRVQLPLAWPVILSGVRVSAQMTMGIAAIAAYVTGPGLGGLIFTGLTRLGGANALESALTGTLLVVVLALVLDLLLVLLGRLTTPRGIRA
ncbi:ABC transporter permease [Pseudokineococcus basanitobsidens]|uniref:ABC transporter permease n=1 Tax=Pseudokineococcus basanitobsidens TaxID=1926649 RepID=UPI003BB60FCF